MVASTTVRPTDQVEKVVSEILAEHRPLLECLVMKSAERWAALDDLIGKAARDNKTSKKEIMMGIGRGLNKENLDGYVRSLKVMISRAKGMTGISKNFPKERKKGFEAILEKLGKMELTKDQLESLFTLLENKRRVLGHNGRQELLTHPRPVQTEVVNN